LKSFFFFFFFFLKSNNTVNIIYYIKKKKKMKVSVKAIILIFSLTSVYSFHISNELIKRKESNSTIPEAPNNSTVPTNSTVVHSQNDAFFKICSFKGGEEVCEEIYEDETNGGSTCTKAIQKECPLDMNYNEDNINVYCSSYFNADKCKKIYSEGFNTLPECNGKNQKYLEILYENNIKKYTHTSIICMKDNDGKVCPYTSYNFLRKYGQVDDSSFWRYMKESCKSKSCMDVIPLVLENEAHRFKNDELQLLTEAINFFKTNECTALTSDTIIKYKYNFSNIIGCLFAIISLYILL